MELEAICAKFKMICVTTSAKSPTMSTRGDPSKGAAQPMGDLM